MPRFTRKPFQQEILSRHIGEMKTLLHALELTETLDEIDNRPVMDIYETADAIIIEFDLPGFAVEEIRLVIRGAVISLDAVRRCESNDEQLRYHCVERNHGAFRHSVMIPANFDPVSTVAEYSKGVLKITCPKIVDRRIPVKEIAD